MEGSLIKKLDSTLSELSILTTLYALKEKGIPSSDRRIVKEKIEEINKSITKIYTLLNKYETEKTK